jgi:hypothetical protein
VNSEITLKIPTKSRYSTASKRKTTDIGHKNPIDMSKKIASKTTRHFNVQTDGRKATA